MTAGCGMTSIQKFLGHKCLNSIMAYARVHGQTVTADYYATMDRSEQRLGVGPWSQTGPAGESLTGDEREQLLDLKVQLAEPSLSVETLFELVERMCWVLNHGTFLEEKWAMYRDTVRRVRGPPRLTMTGAGQVYCGSDLVYHQDAISLSDRPHSLRYYLSNQKEVATNNFLPWLCFPSVPEYPTLFILPGMTRYEHDQKNHSGWQQRKADCPEIGCVNRSCVTTCQD